MPGLHLIKLTNNIPKDTTGADYPYLGVELMIGQFPINPSAADRASAILRLEIRPYMLVPVNGEPRPIAHPDIKRKIEIPNFAIGENAALVTLAASLIAAMVPEWSSAVRVEI